MDACHQFILVKDDAATVLNDCRDLIIDELQPFLNRAGLPHAVASSPHGRTRALRRCDSRLQGIRSRLVPDLWLPRRAAAVAAESGAAILKAVRWIIAARELYRELGESHDLLQRSSTYNSTDDEKQYTHTCFFRLHFREQTNRLVAVCSSVTAHKLWATVRISDKLQSAMWLESWQEIYATKSIQENAYNGVFACYASQLVTVWTSDKSWSATRPELWPVIYNTEDVQKQGFTNMHVTTSRCAVHLQDVVITLNTAHAIYNLRLTVVFITFNLRL